MFPKRLVDGYHHFLNGRLRREYALYQKLGHFGQKPEVMVICCSDSRVAPEIIFEAIAGEMFVVRNIANIVPPCEINNANSTYHSTSAAIEFAVHVLKVKHILVMGHASCGGVAAFANQILPLSKGNFIGKWVSQIAPVVQKVGPCLNDDRKSWLRQLELGVIEQSLNNLMDFPSVRERVENGTLELHGAYFGIATGVLFIRNPQTGEFQPCLNDETAR